MKPKDRYQQLLDAGFSHEAAVALSGYDPLDDLYRTFPDVLLYVLCAVGALLLIQLAVEVTK